MAKWHAKQYSKKGLQRYPKYNPVYRKFQKFGAGASGAALGFIGGNLVGAGAGWYAGRKLYDMKYPQKYKKRILSVNKQRPKGYYNGPIGSNPGPVLGSPSGKPAKQRSIYGIWPHSKRAHVHKYSY